MKESVCESGELRGMQESVCESGEPGNRQESVWESGEPGYRQGSVCDSGESVTVLSLRALAVTTLWHKSGPILVHIGPTLGPM